MIYNYSVNSYNLKQKAKTPKSPNFSGSRLPNQTFAEFEKWAIQTNFLNSVSDVFIPQNRIGQGCSADVYRIPDNDTFLLRIPNSPYLQSLEIEAIR